MLSPLCVVYAQIILPPDQDRNNKNKTLHLFFLFSAVPALGLRRIA
nr:MAG TPA: hypothetical protein [Bacteriophage sp.]